MSRAQRVLHVLNYSLPYISGYCTRSHYILKAQKGAGLEVEALTSPRHDEIVPGSARSEEIDGITYIRTGAGALPGNPVARAARFVSLLAARIEETARDFRPTVIHAHSPSLCGMAARRAASTLAVPVVYEVRALWEEAAVDQNRMSRLSWRYLASRYIETRLLRRADRIVVLCEALGTEIARRAGDPGRVAVVPNGVDHSFFSPREKNRRLLGELGLEGCVVIGFIGTFFRFEGLDDLVRAFDRVAATDPRARLLLVGYGELGPALERMVREIQHGDRVELTGRIPHEAILDYYSIMDIMVYPRKRIRLTELVTPLKPLEAMSMAKPVVVSDVGGLVELVDGGRAGTLFRAGDPGDLAGRILELVRDEQLRERMGRGARSYILSERGWDSIVEKYVGIYDELTG